LHHRLVEDMQHFGADSWGGSVGRITRADKATAGNTLEFLVDTNKAHRLGLKRQRHILTIELRYLSPTN